MIGHYADRPAEFAAALKATGLSLVSFAFGSKSGFTLKERIGADLETAQRWIDFASAFPGALVSIGSATVVSDGPRDDKFAIAAEFYNKAGELGRRAGVDVAVHPSSHHNTLLFDRADYDRIFGLIDPSLVGWVPDTGHILRGHEDIIDTLTSLPGPHPLRAPEGCRCQRRMGHARQGRLRHPRGDRHRRRRATLQWLAGA